MRWILPALLLCLLGCRGLQGPRASGYDPRVDDPHRPLAEQRKLGREQLALPVESSDVGPRSGNAFPGLPNTYR